MKPKITRKETIKGRNQLKKNNRQKLMKPKASSLKRLIKIAKPLAILIKKKKEIKYERQQLISIRN